MGLHQSLKEKEILKLFEFSGKAHILKSVVKMYGYSDNDGKAILKFTLDTL